MFFGADAFNQAIGAWNMSAVTNMWGCSVELMFYSAVADQLVIAEVFQAPMGWWKASTMFFGADAFNQAIGAWNMSAVTNMG